MPVSLIRKANIPEVLLAQISSFCVPSLQLNIIIIIMPQELHFTIVVVVVSFLQEERHCIPIRNKIEIRENRGKEQ